jgi:hypothetical protein
MIGVGIMIYVSILAKKELNKRLHLDNENSSKNEILPLHVHKQNSCGNTQ